ncbi:hypothetical protein D3C84_606050 [compost metagenome]
MISNHLSLVEALRPISNELTAQVEKYLASGGKIEEAAPYNYKPKPISYSNQMPPAPKPFVRRRVEAPPPPPDAFDARQQARERLVDQVRGLSSTHTQVEVAAVVGVSRKPALALCDVLLWNLSAEDYFDLQLRQLGFDLCQAFFEHQRVGRVRERRGPGHVRR